jgi:FixJ family two-component response regulator
MPKRITVGIVDDDPSILASMDNLMKAHGFATRRFASAEAFLDCSWGTTDIDCLLLDIHLGGMSGMELQRQLKASSLKLPIIFITASDDEAVRKQAIVAGCVAYLIKPVSSRSLIEAIEKAAH